MEFLVIIGIWGILVALAPIGVWNAKARLTKLEAQIHRLEQKIVSLTSTATAPKPIAAPVSTIAPQTVVAHPAPQPTLQPLASYIAESAPTVPAHSFRPVVTTHDHYQSPYSTQPPAKMTPPVFTPPPRQHVNQDETLDLISPFAGWLTYALTGGRLFVTLGLLLLFIGVAMLLTYVAHTVTIPIEMRFTGIALAACGLTAFGNRQMGKRREFGLYLQGGGLGILFLTVFTAFKFYNLLPSSAAFILLALIGGATFALSMLYDALPLALMAVTGGFMAPLLTSTGHGDPAELFSYYLLINLVIFAIAWTKTWRVLNMVGFGFTFVIGLFWGGNYYGPQYYTMVQGFLILYFLLYTGMGMLYAMRSTPRLKHPIEGSSVFGVPLIGFGLQLILVRHFNDGASLSALGMGSFYGMLYFVCKVSTRPGIALLGGIYKWMSLLFITLAVPLHFDMHIAAPLWAMEGTALLWMMNRERHRLYGYGGMLLLGLANFLMLKSCCDGLFFSQLFIPMALLALAHFAASKQLSGARDFFFTDKQLDMLISLGGIIWWLIAGLGEINDVRPSTIHQAMPMLLFFTLSAAAAWFAHKYFSVVLLDKPANFILPVLLLAAIIQVLGATDSYHPFMDMGVVALPLAFAVHYAWLMHYPKRAKPWQHIVAYIAMTVLAGLELGYWLNVIAPGDAKRVCGAMLATAGGIWLLLSPAKDKLRAFESMTDGLRAQTLKPLAGWLGLLCLYSFMQPVAGLQQGYIPLLNIVEFSELLSIASLIVMVRKLTLPPEEQSLTRLMSGLIAFAFVNSVALRIASHALEVPYLGITMFAAPAVQTLLTILWAVTSMGLMIASSQNRLRIGWSAGATLLAIVVLKLFFVDLVNSGTLWRIVSFMGVGLLTLAMGYIAPMPPKEKKAS